MADNGKQLQQQQNTETKNNKQKINQQSNKRIHVPTTIYATSKKKNKNIKPTKTKHLSSIIKCNSTTRITNTIAM